MEVSDERDELIPRKAAQAAGLELAGGWKGAKQLGVSKFACKDTVAKLAPC